MPTNSNLEKGGEAGASGAVHRTHDKYGKRRYLGVAQRVAGAINTAHSKSVRRLKVFLGGK